MRLGTGLLIAALSAAPMIASATISARDTFEVHSSDVVTTPVSVPEPGTIALLLAGLGGIAVTRRRR